MSIIILYQALLLQLWSLLLLAAPSCISSTPLFSRDMSLGNLHNRRSSWSGMKWTALPHGTRNDYCIRRNKITSLITSTRGGAADDSSDFYNEYDENNNDEELFDSIFLTTNDKLTNSVIEKSRNHKKSRRGPASLHNNSNKKINNRANNDDYKQQQSSTTQQKHYLQQRKEMLIKLAMSMQDAHTSTIQSLIKGNAAHIPPALFGQTISQEKAACNEKYTDGATDATISMMAFDERERGGENIDIKKELESIIKNDDGGEEEEPKNNRSFRHIEDPDLLSYWGLTPDARLYGGAQYHRVLRYYHHLFLTVPLPTITDDEVALLTNGITDVHDASELLRAVALLVQQKLELVMEDVLADMTRRLLYVMERQWELVEYSMTLHRPMGGAGTGLGKSGDKFRRESRLYSRYGPDFTNAEKDLMNVLSIAFHQFAQARAEDAHRKSAEDVKSLLRYVTWDMGRARTRNNRNTEYQNSQGGYLTQIEIIRDDTPPILNELPNEQVDVAEETTSSSPTRKKRKQKKKSVYSESTKRRMIARGGAAIGSGRKRSQLRKEQSNENASITSTSADQDEDVEFDEEDDSKSTSLVLTSQTSPMFSGDDEVLSLLLDSLSSTLAIKSETQAGQTQAAVENLTAYITDRMRLDLSSMIRSKFNTFFLLPFYEDLGIYLRRELDSYLASVFE